LTPWTEQRVAEVGYCNLAVRLTAAAAAAAAAQIFPATPQQTTPTNRDSS
jgi:hypothetical protein